MDLSSGIPIYRTTFDLRDGSFVPVRPRGKGETGEGSSTSTLVLFI